MGIKFRCHDCDKKLHVKAFLAGKRGVCPHCGAKVRIPRESQSSEQGDSSAAHVKGSSTAVAEEDGPDRATAPTRTAGAPTSSPSRPAAGQQSAATAPGTATHPRGADPINDAPDAVWYVRPPSGGQYGPADAEIMRRWLDEGRVSADSLVWREGWADWKAADSVFSSLAQPVSIPSEAAASSLPVVPQQNAFEFVDNRPLRKADMMRGSPGRNVVIVVTLTVVCVALLVTLFLVLRN